MNQEIHEQLSALMDGELKRDQTRFLLKRVGNDAALTACWTRYHVTRHALRRQPLDPLRMNLAIGVMRALAAETPMRARTPWLRWASGGAIAASVAVAALMVSHPTGDQPIEGAVANAIPAPPSATLAAIPAGRLPSIAASAPANDFQAPLLMSGAPSEMASAHSSEAVQPVSFDPHLQSYLMRHYEATGAAGQSSFLPYVLLVVPPQQSAPAARPEYPAQNH